MNEKEIIDTNIVPFLEEFYKSYYEDYLKAKNKTFSKINKETSLEENLDFDWEAYDYFIGEFVKRNDIDISNFYQNTHFQGMSYEIKKLPSKLLLPLIGLKKWMVFKKDARVPIKIKNLVYAFENKSLKSIDIFESIDRNNEQEKLFKRLKHTIP